MPPEPYLDKTQSADEDENSDPFTDVHIDEDIDSAMKSWEGLMNKKHSKVHKQALKLPEGDRPEPGQGNLQLHPDLEARGRGAAQVEQGGGELAPESVRGREVLSTQMMRCWMTEKRPRRRWWQTAGWPPLCLCLSTRSSSGTSLNIGPGKYKSFRICQCSDLVYAGLRPRRGGRVLCSGLSSAKERQRHQADEQL